jgi:hypothetical protein
VQIASGTVKSNCKLADKGNDKKQFGSDDIRRYLSGEMSDAERYALEREALEDPFLADAIEGMESRLPASNLSQDFAGLQNRLEARIKKRPGGIVAPFYKVAAAAIVFLLAGSLSILYFLNRAKDAGPETMATDLPTQQSRQSSADTSVGYFPAPTDSGIVQPAPPGPIERPIEAPSLSQKKEEVRIAPGILSRRDDMQLRKAKIADSNSRPTIGYPGNPELATTERQMVASAERSSDSLQFNQLSEVVVSRESLPLKEPVLRPESRPKPVTTSNPEVNTMMVRKRATNNAVVEPDRTAWFSIQPLSSDSAAFGPAGSWKAYNGRGALRSDSEKALQETVLQFRINAQGQPQDLRILKTENSARSAEIIRTIQNGPLWKIKPGLDSTVKVLIRF